MSAGYIQLAAIGQQDAFLTGSPSVTYFQGMYSRNTPFVLEAYEIPFNGTQVNFGSQSICRVPFKGDIIRGLTLKINMPALNNPGNDWSWSNVASESGFYPKITIDGKFFRAPTTGITYYSSNLQSMFQCQPNFPLNIGWISNTAPFGQSSVGTLSTNVFYDANVNKFTFTAYSNVTVEPAQALFWGFDPKNFDNVFPDGNLNYVWSTSSFHQTTNGKATSDFTLEQAGWTRGNGLPNATSRAGLYLQVQQAIIPAVIPTAFQFQMYTRTGDSTPNYVFFNAYRSTYISQVTGSTFCSVSTLGSIVFSNPGLYCIRGSILTSGTDATYSIAYGFSSTDGHPGTGNFLVEHVITQSMQPSATFCITVYVPVATYMYIDIRLLPTTATIQPGSWFAITPLDQAFLNYSPITTGTQLALQNFTSYGQPGGGTQLLTLIPSSNSFYFNQYGSFLITTSLALQNSTLTSIQLSKGVRGGSPTSLFTYTTYQGQYGFPSLDFVIPVNVLSSDIGVTPFFIDITMQNLAGSVAGDTIVGSNVSSIQFIQNTSPTPTASYPQNGIMFTPSGASGSQFSLSSPINFSSANWTQTGGTTQISAQSQNIQFFIGGLFTAQFVLYTADLLKSVSVAVTSGVTSSTSTFTVGIGLLPPYSFSVPFYIASATTLNPAIATISYTTTAGSTTYALSNTVVSIGMLASNLTPTYSYIDSIGTYVVQQADLKIGGQLVQSITGEQIELYNDLYVPYENQVGLKLLTGKQDVSNVFDPGRTYYVNLPYYFYNNPELSVPICALGRSDVEVYVTFAPFSGLSFLSSLAGVSQTFSATMIVEYGFLSDAEVTWMQRNRLEYLITQNQFTSFDLPAGFTTGTFKLPFLNPVRELYMVIQNGGTAPYDFTNNGLTNLGLSFNGQEFLSRQITDNQYLQYVQTFQKYNVTPIRKFYVYAFANDPMNPRPTGQINFSRIKDISLDVTTSALANVKKSLRVYAMSYNIVRIENGIAGMLFNFTTPAR